MGQAVQLSGASWADYCRLLDVRGERRWPSISYLDGTLELMTPSDDHEGITFTIARLFEVFCLAHDIEFRVVGSWTIKDSKKRSGAESDQCYVLSEVPARPKRPDLAIEVTWSSGSTDKLEIYRRLGVPEVWYWADGKIDVYLLRGDRYSHVTRSRAIPGIDLDEIAKLAVRPEMTSKLMRRYRASLRKRHR
jgi:Uma2 family endonuclease